MGNEAEVSQPAATAAAELYEAHFVETFVALGMCTPTKGDEDSVLMGIVPVGLPHPGFQLSGITRGCWWADALQLDVGAAGPDPGNAALWLETAVESAAIEVQATTPDGTYTKFQVKRGKAGSELPLIVGIEPLGGGGLAASHGYRNAILPPGTVITVSFNLSALTTPPEGLCISGAVTGYVREMRPVEAESAEKIARRLAGRLEPKAKAETSQIALRLPKKMIERAERLLAAYHASGDPLREGLTRSSVLEAALVHGLTRLEDDLELDGETRLPRHLAPRVQTP